MEVLKPFLNNGNSHGEAVASTGRPDANTMTEIEWSYLAGIIDGEGTITIERTTSLATMRGGRHATPKFQTTLSVTTTSTVLLDWLQHRLGGNRYKMTGTNLQCYGWKFNSRKARKILDGVRPYLIIKARQADIVQTFFDGRIGYRNLRCSPEEVARREGLYAEIRSLNRPWFVAAETKRKGARPNE